jgi:tRNA (adenine57-N1/adenine58-N1)-methyltransferase catalytic subunit
VRPEHRMVGHTGFLITARRLADGVVAPPRRRRPSKGAEAALAEAALAATAVAEAAPAEPGRDGVVAGVVHDGDGSGKTPTDGS